MIDGALELLQLQWNSLPAWTITPALCMMGKEIGPHRDRAPTNHPVHAAAFEFAADIYAITRRLPSHERFGIIAQLRRAATSIASNLAEGGARLGAKQLHHFAGIAYGSARECELLLRLCVRIEYLTEAEAAPCLEAVRTVSKQLLGILRALHKRNNAADR